MSAIDRVRRHAAGPWAPAPMRRERERVDRHIARLQVPLVYRAYAPTGWAARCRYWPPPSPAARADEYRRLVAALREADVLPLPDEALLDEREWERRLWREARRRDRMYAGDLSSEASVDPSDPYWVETIPVEHGGLSYGLDSWGASPA